ncbi:MAG: FtsX-like permease family protein [Sedimentisphaerales bacterium]
MRLHSIVLKSLRQHWLSSSLALISIAVGSSLLIAVTSLREQSHKAFTESGIGVDAILGPKGSSLQIVLNAIYNLETMPGKVKWSYYKKVLQAPIVVKGIPFCTGHSYGGFRVNAIDPAFLTEFEYVPGKTFSFNKREGGAGRRLENLDEAVAGSVAAKELHIVLGSTFNPVCGVQSGDPVHVNDHIKFVGILAPTGTPYDRAIYIPLERFYTLEGHNAKMAIDEDYREISGAYLKIKSGRGGTMNPAIQALKYDIDQSQDAQLVIPNEVMPRLFNIIGWVDNVLFAVALMVTVLATLFLFVALISALKDRRRDIALMRTLGATRLIIVGLVLSEALIISLAGVLSGLLLGHCIVEVGCYYVHAETGLLLSPWYISSADIWILPGAAVISLLAGIIPAIAAYRQTVVQNLIPVS